MRAAYVDTSVLLIAAGEPSPGREAARTFLAQAEDGLELHVSVEVIQEFAFHRLRRGTRESALLQVEALMQTVVIHAFDQAVLRRALKLMRDTPLRGRDSVHAATALEVGLDTLVTLDKDFDGVPGLQAIGP